MKVKVNCWQCHQGHPDLCRQGDNHMTFCPCHRVKGQACLVLIVPHTVLVIAVSNFRRSRQATANSHCWRPEVLHSYRPLRSRRWIEPFRVSSIDIIMYNDLNVNIMVTSKCLPSGSTSKMYFLENYYFVSLYVRPRVRLHGIGYADGIMDRQDSIEAFEYKLKVKTKIIPTFKVLGRGMLLVTVHFLVTVSIYCDSYLPRGKCIESIEKYMYIFL